MFVELLMSLAFASGEPPASEAVFGQMRAATHEIQSLSFEFRATEEFTPRWGVKGPPKTREKHFIGKAWFAAPDNLRVEFQEGAGLEFDANVPRNSVVGVTDGSVSRLLTTDNRNRSRAW